MNKLKKHKTLIIAAVIILSCGIFYLINYYGPNQYGMPKPKSVRLAFKNTGSERGVKIVFQMGNCKVSDYASPGLLRSWGDLGYPLTKTATVSYRYDQNEPWKKQEINLQDLVSDDYQWHDLYICVIINSDTGNVKVKCFTKENRFEMFK